MAALASSAWGGTLCRALVGGVATRPPMGGNGVRPARGGVPTANRAPDEGSREVRGEAACTGLGPREPWPWPGVCGGAGRADVVAAGGDAEVTPGFDGAGADEGGAM